MKKEKIIKFIADNSITLGLTIVFILLHIWFEKIINIFFVLPILSKVNNGFINDSIIILIFFIIGANFWLKKEKNYRVTLKSLLQYSIVLFVYLYYRYWGDIWYFEGFSFINKIKYFDILSLYYWGNIILFFMYKSKKHNSDINNGFNLDTPIGKEKPDLLNRERFAEYICGEIDKTESPDSSFAIGISSEWGNGKTSFIDLLEKHLKSSENIIIKINPWINHESRSIVTDFFNVLSLKLSEYNSDISPLIKKYAELLVGVGNSNLNKILNPILKYYTQNSTAISEFEQINNAIKKLDKKLVVFIDDLDRLYKDEIIQVVKLIRNSANFGNTVFIVTYDRNYVVNALKEINNYNPEFFLEKIFQFEFHLPKIESQIIQKQIYNLLYTKIRESDRVELSDILFKKKRSYDMNNFNLSSITNLRDVTRFSNSFLLAYSYLKGEIVLCDLLNIEILRLKYPGVYKLIFFQTDNFLEATTNSFKKTYYSLRNTKDEAVNNSEIISQYLIDNYESVGISKSEIDYAIMLLYSLFPSQNDVRYSRGVKLLSICNPSSFERYSYYSLLEGNISEVEFSNYRLKSFDKFTEKINEWVNNGQQFELKGRLERIKDYSDKDDFEKNIKAIFFFARLPKGENIHNNFIGFDFDNLYNKLNNVKKYLKINYYSTKEEYLDFIVNVLINAPSPYVFESDFIDRWLGRFAVTSDFGESIDPFIAIRLEYLKKYLDETEKFDHNVWGLYHNNDLRERKQVNGHAYSIEKRKNPEAISLIVEFIRTKALDDFLFAIISSERSDNKLYMVGKVVEDMFGDYNKFGEFINIFDEDKYINLHEFKKFYDKLKIVDYKQYVSFDFKVIPVDQKNR